MHALVRKLRRAATLTPRDWLVLAEAWGELTRVKARLTFDAPATIREALEARAAGSSSQEVPPRLLEVFEMATGNHLYDPNCLPKALVLKRMLSRRGIEATLRIGAHKEGNTLFGHAWIEVGSVPVNESPDVATRFAPLSIRESAGVYGAAK